MAAGPLFALGLGTVAHLALRAAGRHTAIVAGLRRVFIAICVFCAFYSVIAAGVFNYFGRPFSYDLLKLVHGVAAVESSIVDRITLPIAVALVGVPDAYYALTRRLARKPKAPVFIIATPLALGGFRLLAILSAAEALLHAPPFGASAH